jgi:hypothetical protein
MLNFNEPLPDPSTLSSIDRVRIINQARSEQLSGIEHSEDILNWLLRLYVLERQASTGRGSSTTTAKAPPVPTKLEDL